jgi:hypothetical protein
MATKISTIYDSIYTKISGVLTDHKELYYPTQIELNDEILLEKGFAISLGNATPSNRNLSCLYWIRRDILITNTLSVFAPNTNDTIRKTKEKDLFENQIKIILAVEKDTYLQSQITNFRFDGDNGIQYIYGEANNNFIMLQSRISFEYFENLTTI